MNQSIDIHPPKWPLKFLRFFVKKEYVEEIEGDMEEIFYDNVEQLSLRKARRMYTWEMFKLLRPILLKNLEVLNHFNQHAMFKNYLKVSIRGLMKSPLNSFINVFGLSVAIGVSVFVYSFARWTYSTDQFHEHKNEVFLATFFADRDGTPQQYGKSPRPLGEMLKADFTHVKKVCRVEDRNVVMKHEDNVFHERIRFVDPEFLEMFTFPLKWGIVRSLADVNSIVLSEKMSIKYFGDENPIGQTVLVKFDKDRSKAFKITGVAEDFPKALTIRFDFLINFENLKSADPTYDVHDWNAFVNATLIQIDPSHIKTVKQGMGKYKLMQNEAAEKDWAISAFGFEPLATLHERSEDIREGISRSSGSNFRSIIYLSVLGIFILALACFNYINIAIVSAAKRLKEIGVRKSIGATRRVVIVQFLSENMVVMFFALIIGLTLGATVFIPWFENQWDFSMDFRLFDKNLWIYLPLVMLLTGIASGIYPSLYISKFQVVGILKGSVKFGQKNPLTKIFLGVQVMLACIFISTAVMFTQNTDYLGKRSWGYNQHEALYAEVTDQLAFEQLNAAMVRNPNVVSISGSTHHLGRKNATTVLHLPDHEYEVDQLSVDANYFEAMGLQLTEGRGFHHHEGSDKQAVIVNESLVKSIGWSKPIGETFELDSTQVEVIGVVKDFHSYSFSKHIKPTIFSLADKADYRYLSMRVLPGSEIETYKAMQAQWIKLFPEIPFQGGHQEDVWGNYYEEIKIHGRVWRVFATMAVLLASLGLYGLISLNVAGRVREFSIRKVLGAATKNITATITKPYLLLYAVALIAGAPVSYILNKFLFDSAYTYHMPITYSGAIVAVVILLLVLLITVSTQIRKVIKANPVNGLKVE